MTTTEFKRTEEDMLDYLDNAAIGLHWVDGNTTILWANPSDYEPLGYTADEYIGHSITEFHADPDVINDILTRLLAGETLRLMRKSLEEFRFLACRTHRAMIPTGEFEGHANSLHPRRVIHKPQRSRVR
jgi:PAS domain S-box-containing protein